MKSRNAQVIEYLTMFLYRVPLDVTGLGGAVCGQRDSYADPSKLHPMFDFRAKPDVLLYSCQTPL